MACFWSENLVNIFIELHMLCEFEFFHVVERKNFTMSHEYIGLEEYEAFKYFT